MSGIDKYAYKSKISHVKAENKLAFAGSLLVICLFFSSDIISGLTIAVMSAATLMWGGCRPGSYIKLLSVPLAFLLTGVLTIVITQLGGTDTALFSIRLSSTYYGLTYQSLRTGANILLKSFGAITCLYFFSLNTPMNSFLSLIRKKFPGIIVELMELIYRFIFIVWEEAAKIHIAQASRLGYNGFKSSMYSTGELAASVFIRAMRRVERMNVSLESRGFDGNFNYLIEGENTSKMMNTCTVIVSAALIAAGIVERLLL